MADPAPNCSRCIHFFVTYDASAPRGCHAYGFKSMPWPTQVVLESSGAPCKHFEQREEPRKKGAGRR